MDTKDSTRTCNAEDFNMKSVKITSKMETLNAARKVFIFARIHSMCLATTLYLIVAFAKLKEVVLWTEQMAKRHSHRYASQKKSD